MLGRGKAGGNYDPSKSQVARSRSAYLRQYFGSVARYGLALLTLVAGLFALFVIPGLAQTWGAGVLIWVTLVLVGAGFGGLGPGLMITTLGTLLGASANQTDGQTLWNSLFTLVGVSISWTIESLQTARRRMDDQSQAFSAILRASVDHIYVLDRSGRYRYVSDGAAHVLGLDPQDVIGRTWRDLELSPKMMEPFDVFRGSVVASNKPITAEINFESAEGPQVFEYSMTLMDGKSTTPGEVVVISREITERKQGENNIARLAAIFESSGDAIISKSLDGVITSWNDGAKRLFGYTTAEALGRSIEFLIPLDRRSEEASLLERIHRGERFEQFESVRIAKDGRRIDVSLTISRISDAAGKIIGVSKIARDITERKRVEEALRESEGRLRSVTDTARVGLVVVDADHCYRFANRAYREILDISQEDIVGLKVADVLAPVYESQIRPRLERAFMGERVTYELTVPNRDGKPGDFDSFTVAYEPEVDGSGVKRVVVVVVDVTEQRRAERSFKENEGRLGLFIEHAPAAIAMFDREMRYIAASRRWLSDYEIGEQDLIGRSHYDIFPDLPERWKTSHSQALSGGVVLADEDRFDRANGTVLWLRWEVRPWINTAGEIGGIVVATENITDRKRAEEANARLAAIVESSEDVIIGKDLAGLVTSWNRGAERIFGYSATEMIGSSIKRLIPLDRKDEEARILEKLRHGEMVSHFESLRQTKDGRLIDVSLTISPIRDGSGLIIGASKIARDITERKLAEKSLRESEARFRIMANAMPQLAWIARPDGHIFWYNQPWYDYTGMTPEQMEGWGWQSVHDVRELPQVLESWQTSIATGEPFEMTIPLRGVDGRFRRFLTRVLPLKDSAGKVMQWCGTNTDVDELSRANDALRESEHRTRLATEATGVGIWEWNTMTNQIRWDAQMFNIYGITPTKDGLVDYGTWREAVLPEDLPEQEEVLRDTIRRHGESSREFRIRRPGENGTRVIEAVNKVRANAQGQAEWVVGASLDITERNQAAEAQARLAAIVESSDDSIVSEDLDGSIVSWNVGAQRIFGYTASETIGRQIDSILISTDTPDEVHNLLRTSFPGEPIRNFETRRLRNDGSFVDISETVSLIRNQAGEDIGVSRIHRDITERRRAEDQIHRREQELSDFFENATIGLHWMSPDGVILRANHAELEMLGYGSEEYVGRHIAEFHDRREVIDEILQRLQSGETIRDQPARLLHKDGSTRDVLIDASVRWEDGRFVHTRCFTRDVTERNRSEMARRESERMARSVLDSLSANIAVLDEEGVILAVNHSWFEFAKQNQAAGGVSEGANYLRVCEAAKGEDAAGATLFAAGIRDVLSGRRSSFSLEYPCHSPMEKRWFVGRVLPFLGDGPRRVVVVHLDVTEQRLADEALGKYAARLEALSRRLLRAQEDERRRIARELHDEVGQSLTAAKIAVDRIVGLPAVATVSHRLADASSLINVALDQVRDLSRLLRPSILDDLGLEAALTALIEGVTERTGIDINLNFDPVIGTMDPEAEITCYRIAQEAINNAVKHARATRLEVSLYRGEANLELIIADDGAGFDVVAATTRASRGTSLGLLSLSERATLAGGFAVIESRSGEGTQVRAVLPARRRQERVGNLEETC